MNTVFKSYLNKNYSQIKEKCLNSGELFEDDKFPAHLNSLTRFNKKQNLTKIKWKRPKEFCEPEFIHNGIEPNDIDQGQLGDW